MVSGCISGNGVILIWWKTSAPEAKRLIGENVILHQDNAPTHKAKIDLKFLSEEDIII